MYVVLFMKLWVVSELFQPLSPLEFPPQIWLVINLHHKQVGGSDAGGGW